MTPISCLKAKRGPSLGLGAAALLPSAADDPPEALKINLQSLWIHWGHGPWTHESPSVIANVTIATLGNP